MLICNTEYGMEHKNGHRQCPTAVCSSIAMNSIQNLKQGKCEKLKILNEKYEIGNREKFETIKSCNYELC